MSFGSDNFAGVAPEILNALMEANDGPVLAYGNDPITLRAEAKFAEIFECELTVFFVATGGAANGLALSVMGTPYSTIMCHEQSHIQMDECAGPEFFTGGAKLLPISGGAGKVRPSSISSMLACFPNRPPHGSPIKTLSLTQATECGTVYSVSELTRVCATVHQAGLKVHMDGARFANAVATLGCSPADLSWKAGVDVLCFGGTKNGCMAAEAVVFFNADDVVDFDFRRKRAGHLVSKQRFVSAQMESYLTDGLWLRLANQANRAAQDLSQKLQEISGVKVWYPTQINEVFVSFPEGVAEKLRSDGMVFYPWVTPGDPAGGTMQRLICSFNTTDREVDGFVEAVGRAMG